jgi:hypothetical protein
MLSHNDQSVLQLTRDLKTQRVTPFQVQVGDIVVTDLVAFKVTHIMYAEDRLTLCDEDDNGTSYRYNTPNTPQEPKTLVGNFLVTIVDRSCFRKLQD